MVLLVLVGAVERYRNRVTGEKKDVDTVSNTELFCVFLTKYTKEVQEIYYLRNARSNRAIIIV